MREDDLRKLSREELVILVEDLLRVTQEQQVRLRRLDEELARLRREQPSASSASAASSPSEAPSGSDVAAGTQAPSGREVPSFVKPNRPSREAKPRKRRSQGYARPRQTPTEVVTHAPACCSQCGRTLSGGWVHACRQVIEIPPPTPVMVIEHQFVARHCGVCQRREFSRADLSGQVVGQSRLGVRLMSLIAYLYTQCRLPLSTLQQLLLQQYGLHLSEGELVRVLHTVASAGSDRYEHLRQEVCRSKVVQGDETGAREDGLNGYLWSLSTPTIRYYHRDPSRSSAVVQRLLGHDPRVYAARSAKAVRAVLAQREAEATPKGPTFTGTLVSDFFSGYRWYPGEHQCCLVHLDRDLDALRAAHADDAGVVRWVDAVLDLIEGAKTYTRTYPTAEWAPRRRKRRALEKEAARLARPYLGSGLPQQVLAERIRTHLGQLFVFVEKPEVPPDNNAAERAIRPFVVHRKIRGGTRSAAGSQTQAILLSLFGTWQVRGQDPLTHCQQMLATFQPAASRSGALAPA